MSTLDINAVLELTAERGKTKAVAPKVCSHDDCELDRIPRSTFCATHKVEHDAQKALRVKAYRNLLREAMTSANAADTKEEAADHILRLTKGNVGYAYFLKESFPSRVVKLEGVSGTFLRMDSLEQASAFATITNESDIAEMEGFAIQLVATIKPPKVEGWKATDKVVAFYSLKG